MIQIAAAWGIKTVNIIRNRWRLSYLILADFTQKIIAAMNLKMLLGCNFNIVIQKVSLSITKLKHVKTVRASNKFATDNITVPNFLKEPAARCSVVIS